MGEGYSDRIEYDLPKDEGDKSDPIMFQQYLSNMNAKTGNKSVDKLFHTISHENDPITVHFMYFSHHKVEATQVLNGIPCILSEELLVNPNNFITISGIQWDTMGTWDKDKRTFTNPNELHNEEAM